ncbi:MAG: hypothetical protein CFE28_08035 [Alphaproteobacteria bacterium PA2]|nr:MAG: hypothetical protein CFE28_08035 [Alphaproteobacteria bacterium PA2]
MVMSFNLRQRLGAKLRAFGAARGGNVAVMFALTFSTVMMLSGFAVDFQRSSGVKQRLQDIADQAALAGVGHNAVYDGESYRYDAGKSKAAAKAFFEANLKLADFGDDVVVTPSYKAVVDGASVTATVGYKARVKTVIAGMFGMSTMKVSGQAVGNSATPNYVDIIVLVDTSPSMLMGASDADQDTMIAKSGCYLACHGQEAGYRALGVVFRLDVVAAAVAAMIDDLKTNTLVPQQYRVTIYGFSNTLFKIQNATTDLDVAKAAAANIEAMDPEGTNSTKSLQQLAQSLPTGGTGSDINHRQQFMLLFTDGTTNDVARNYDAAGNYIGWKVNPDFTAFAPTQPVGWRTQGFNPADCAPIKAKKTTVMTLNTTYVVRPGETDQRTLFIKDKLLDKIENNMAQCASQSDYAFVANDAAQIKDATEKLTLALLSSAHITN